MSLLKISTRKNAVQTDINFLPQECLKHTNCKNELVNTFCLMLLFPLFSMKLVHFGDQNVLYAPSEV